MDDLIEQLEAMADYAAESGEAAHLEKICRAAVDELNLKAETYKDLDERFDGILNDLWRLVYPDKTDWEYPGQVVVHLRQFIAEKENAIIDLQQKNRTLMQMAQLRHG